MTAYVHGYSDRENVRLTDQADTLADLLHNGTHYGRGQRVLECGCGTGAQTLHLAAHSPRARFVSMDISADSLAAARSRVEKAGLTNVVFEQGDLYNLAFPSESFDHAFVCFVLEHLSDPERALAGIGNVIAHGGTLTVIEGDHGSWYCHPETSAARHTVECLIEVQARLLGDALIGRRLFPLLESAGFSSIHVAPKMVYVDGSRPDLAEGFSRNTFIAMVSAVEEQAVEMGITDRDTWRRGIRDLQRAAQPDGTFCYTFFKATAIR